nr:hypothetical protein [Desulfurispira natronophila]
MNQYLEELLERTESHVKLGLENTHRALEILGNPHCDYRSILVAGSNGKGTTAAYIFRGLELSGLRVGLFSSPHIVRLNERLRTCEGTISDDELKELVDDTFAICKAGGVRLTFFELMTVAGARYFSRKKCDVVVVEVGLGGRLDSTNVHPNFASVVTSIGMEHTAILGDDIDTIAAEKLATVKPGGKLICDGLAPWAGVARRVVAEKEARMLDASQAEIDPEVEACLSYPFFRENFQLAQTLLQTLEITDMRLLQEVARTRLFGRMEPLAYKKRHVLLDCAHNPVALEKMGPYILEWTRPFKRRILATTLLADKELDPVTRSFWDSFDAVALFPLNHPRGRKSPAELFPLIAETSQRNLMVAPSLQEGLSRVDDILLEDEHSCLVVTGSMYLLGEVYPLMEPHLDPR